MTVLERIRAVGIVPVVVLDEACSAVPTAEAMLAGGINVMEITLRTNAALEAIQEVRQQCPDMLVGAGTVISLDQCRAAVDRGAMFIVSPGYNPEVVQWCMDHDVPVIPGCVTPTEITQAIKQGLQVLKFFPANVYGGLDAMKALSAPFGGISFIPTGGVNEKNVGEYIQAPCVFAVGGSWVCSRKLIQAGDFETITSLCRAARSAAQGEEHVIEK